MNCIEFRHRVGAEPSVETETLQAHAASCESCARFWRGMKQLDRLIHRALRIDAPALGHPAVHRTRGYRAAAASFIVAVALGAPLWLAQPRTSLAEQVVAHVQHENTSMVQASVRVDDDELSSILKRAGVRLKPGSMQVSYAMNCRLRGHYVPHLVAQMADGPITVLVLPYETSVSKPQSFDEAGFSGVITPAPRGALVVLARGASATRASQAVLDALDYET